MRSNNPTRTTEKPAALNDQSSTRQSSHLYVQLQIPKWRALPLSETFGNTILRI